mgnify:CR=1 FL=1
MTYVAMTVAITLSVWWLPVGYTVIALAWLLFGGENTSFMGWPSWTPSTVGLLLGLGIVPAWAVFFALMFFFGR